MHEFSVALNIVDIASGTAKDAGAERINEVEIDVGVLSGVIVEALEFALESAVIDTLLENAKITINEIKSKARCNECGTEFSPESHIEQCPQCGSFGFDIIRGKELRVKSINVD